MKVVISPKAEKQLKKLSKIDQIAVSKKIRQIVTDQSFRLEKLSDFRDIYRVRVGSIRIVFKKTKDLTYIVIIHHRRDVYKLLKKLLD